MLATVPPQPQPDVLWPQVVSEVVAALHEIGLEPAVSGTPQRIDLSHGCTITRHPFKPVAIVRRGRRMSEVSLDDDQDQIVDDLVGLVIASQRRSRSLTDDERAALAELRDMVLGTGWKADAISHPRLAVAFADVDDLACGRLERHDPGSGQPVDAQFMLTVSLTGLTYVQALRALAVLRRSLVAVCPPPGLDFSGEYDRPLANTGIQ